MKRSRIILGMAALCVAAFGAFAFSTTSSTVQSWYIPDDEPDGCELFQPVECELGTTEDCTHPGIPATNKQAYSDNTCQTPLSREQGF